MQKETLPLSAIKKKNSKTLAPSFLLPPPRFSKLSVETNMKILRETGSTLCPTPKNKTKMKLSDFYLLKLLGKGRFGSVYLAM